MIEQHYTVKEVHEKTKLSKKQLYRLINLGKLKAKTTGKRFVIPESSLQDLEYVPSVSPQVEPHIDTTGKDIDDGTENSTNDNQQDVGRVE